MDEGFSCCFTGHRPAKLPWGYDEHDPRALALKQAILREVEALYRRGCRRFICGMALGCDLLFAEAVLEFRDTYPRLTLEAAIPFPGQAERWSERNRLRRDALLARCDSRTVVQDHYDRGCMLRRDRYMVDHADVVLAVYADSPGGTRYTLDYAASLKKELLLIDLNHPERPAADMICSDP